VKELTRLQWMKDRFVDAGAWLRPFGDVVYLMPPFTIAADELAALTRIVVRVLQDWSREA